MEYDLTQLTDLNAEKSILGSVMMDNEVIFHCLNLRPEDFFSGVHRDIFKAMREIALSGGTIDVFSIADQARKMDLQKLDPVLIASMIDGIVNSRVENSVQIVKNFGLRRAYVSACIQSINMAYDMSESTQDCISVAQDKLLKLAGSGDHKSVVLKDYSFDVYDKIRKLAAVSPYETIGLTTGIKRLDDATTGLREGEYWVLGSWTGSGKTACVTQMIVANAVKLIPVLWFTQEMTKRQVMLRMIPALTEGKVRAKDLRNPRNMSAAELELFYSTQEIVDRWPLWVNDATAMDIHHLTAHAQMMIKREKIQLIAVDYIQLLKAEAAKTRQERLTLVSAGLRELAKHTGVPVIAVSQLARPEEKKMRAPRPFDLKESGDIENDAHVIVMPWRPQDRDGHFTGEDFIIVGKQREGPTGSVKVSFSTDTLTFDPRGEDEAGGMF